MELITNILVEYLKYNKRIVVPKLGAFIVKQPSGIIRFTDLMRNDDGVLRSLLIAYGMSELEAIGKIDRFVFEVHHAISHGDKYVITGLGEFSAAENNTIVFNHKREPKIIGGNVKPPIETLNIEKIKWGLLTNSIRMSEGATKPHKTKTKSKQAESSPISSNKPDYYLRGLNYDDRKKKRSEERSDKRHAPQRKSPLLLLLILIVVAGGIYALWYWLNSQRSEPQQVKRGVTERYTEIDSLNMQDSLMFFMPLDTLYQSPIMVFDTDIYKTNNIVTE